MKGTDNISPLLRLEIIGGKDGPATPLLFDSINNFSVSCSVLNIYDSFSCEVPVTSKALVRDLARALDVPSIVEMARWWPCKVYHSDPMVNDGAERELLRGVITECHLSGPPTVLRIQGFDLGKLLDSCGPPWKKLREGKLKNFTDLLLDPTWMESNRVDGWGFRGIVGEDINKRLKRTRFAETRDYYAVLDRFMPPLQVEVGQKAYDILARYAKFTGEDRNPLSGSIINVSSTGYLQIFNPSEARDDSPVYVFRHRSVEDNARIISYDLGFTGEPLHSEYRCYSSVIAHEDLTDPEDPNFGKFYGQVNLTAYGSIGGKSTLMRRMTMCDEEQYTNTKKHPRAQARTEWMWKRAEHDAWSLRYTIQGHSMPGPDGKWEHLVEGNIAAVDDQFLGLYDRYYIEQVDLTQRTPGGSSASIVMRPRGLLAA